MATGLAGDLKRDAVMGGVNQELREERSGTLGCSGTVSY